MDRNTHGFSRLQRVSDYSAGLSFIPNNTDRSTNKALGQCSAGPAQPLTTGEPIFVVVHYYRRSYEVDIIRNIKHPKLSDACTGCFRDMELLTTSSRNMDLRSLTNGLTTFCILLQLTTKKFPPLWPRDNGKLKGKTIAIAM